MPSINNNVEGCCFSLQENFMEFFCAPHDSSDTNLIIIVPEITDFQQPQDHLPHKLLTTTPVACEI